MSIIDMIKAIILPSKNRVITGEPVGETVVYEREMAVYNALRLLISIEQPCILGGKYSWLTTSDTRRPLQIDIFFPKITALSGVELATPRSLAVEVQSSLHDGRWNNSKKRFFRSKEDFDRYTEHQEWKRNQLQARKIPFIEIDPSVDDLSPARLRKRLGELFNIIL